MKGRYLEVTAVQDRSMLTPTEIKAEIPGISAVGDSRIQRWIDEAKQAADNYMNNPFWGSPDAPDSTRPIPLEVEAGLVEYIRGAFLTAQGSTQAGVASETVGSWSRSFSEAAQRGSAGMTVAREYWSRYRLEPGF